MTITSAELEELVDLVDSTVTIPTIPTTLLEIDTVVSSDSGSVGDAAAVIEKDPAIATKMLRLVNSPYYGMRSAVSSIQLACSILGLKVIRNLVVQATVIESCRTDAKADGFDSNWLWDHSFKTAMAARLLVTSAPSDLGLEREEAYTCGLVHDVGKILLLDAEPE